MKFTGKMSSVILVGLLFLGSSNSRGPKAYVIFSRLNCSTLFWIWWLIIYPQLENKVIKDSFYEFWMKTVKTIILVNEIQNTSIKLLRLIWSCINYYTFIIKQFFKQCILDSLIKILIFEYCAIELGNSILVISA